jgi:hypothetical protein
MLSLIPVPLRMDPAIGPSKCFHQFPLDARANILFPLLFLLFSTFAILYFLFFGLRSRLVCRNSLIVSHGSAILMSSQAPYSSAIKLKCSGSPVLCQPSRKAVTAGRGLTSEVPSCILGGSFHPPFANAGGGFPPTHCQCRVRTFHSHKVCS